MPVMARPVHKVQHPYILTTRYVDIYVHVTPEIDCPIANCLLWCMLITFYRISSDSSDNQQQPITSNKTSKFTTRLRVLLTCKFTLARLLSATKTVHTQIVSRVKLLVSVLLMKGYFVEILLIKGCFCQVLFVVILFKRE